jgi:hypothetical protein
LLQGQLILGPWLTEDKPALTESTDGISQQAKPFTLCLSCGWNTSCIQYLSCKI